jgi:Rps23 Pro-64 3,4-dihydroxylase Tpa1-like proline 4-hydroxylase
LQTAEPTQWTALGCNERVRFCRYVEGQFFGAHNDAFFSRSQDERSFLTFMIYLNGAEDPVVEEAKGFKGGATNFLKVIDRNVADRVTARIDPEVGSILVFQHNMLHEGELLSGGRKYIMRSDVMYKKNKRHN